jgi:hypothetical protein
VTATTYTLALPALRPTLESLNAAAAAAVGLPLSLSLTNYTSSRASYCQAHHGGVFPSPVCANL